MPLTTLDPQTALIVVDLQKGIVSSPFIHPIDDVVKQSRALIDTFRTQGLPVVLVNVAGGAPAETGVEATARQAYEAGFNVTLAIDAMTDLHPEAHEYSLRHVFPRLGETGSTQDVLDLLAKRSA